MLVKKKIYVKPTHSNHETKLFFSLTVTEYIGLWDILGGKGIQRLNR